MNNETDAVKPGRLLQQLLAGQRPDAAPLDEVAEVLAGGVPDQGDCMKEATKDVVLMKASKREVSTPNAPRNAQRELVGVLCRCAGPTHASLPISVG